jgi:uncharacterized membrane protein YuzA (DUF378 family)
MKSTPRSEEALNAILLGLVGLGVVWFIYGYISVLTVAPISFGIGFASSLLALLYLWYKHFLSPVRSRADETSHGTERVKNFVLGAIALFYLASILGLIFATVVNALIGSGSADCPSGVPARYC